MRRVDQLLWALAFIAGIAFSIGRVPEVMTQTASAADDLHPLVYPFLGDQGPWRIASGYEGSHSPGGDRQYSLSFVAKAGDTAGRTVVAPASGVVSWVDAGDSTWNPHTSNCISFQVEGHDTYYVAVCHVRLDRVHNVGDRVSQGDRIGVIGPRDDGSQVPTVEATLYTASSRRQAADPSARQPVPFAGLWSLSGCGYPADGSGKPRYAGLGGLPDRCPPPAPGPAPLATPSPVTTATSQ